MLNIFKIFFLKQQISASLVTLCVLIICSNLFLFSINFRPKGKMHFVKKVATTKEQEMKKEKERAEKLKIYCKLRDRIFEKRTKGNIFFVLLN